MTNDTDLDTPAIQCTRTFVSDMLRLIKSAACSKYGSNENAG
jgi:hypothetical protein